MNENVISFFNRYNNDADLRFRVENALACYPGSLEIREAVVEEVLLPIADQLGLTFTTDDLRKYETKMKMSRELAPEIDPEDLASDCGYWLLDHGWDEYEIYLDR